MGTAFTIDQDGKQYLVSARHVFPTITDGATIYVSRHAQWEEWKVSVVGSGSGTDLADDVIVLATEKQMSPSFDLPASAGHVIFGQRVYFLGFPYGLGTHGADNGGYPIPFIKGALLSGAAGSTFETFILDGLNNPGFSGGPVVFHPDDIQQKPLSVLGVVSAYRSEESDIFFEGKLTGHKTRANTGLVICPTIKRVTEIIAAKPIGPKVEW